MPQNVKVVIVDDQKNLADILALNFRMHDYEVDTAYDGKEGIQVINNKCPDAILTDFDMPKKNGVDMLIGCRDYITKRKILVILMTAYDEQMVLDAQEQLNQAGIKHFILTKPASFSDIIKVFEKHFPEQCEVYGNGKDICS